jgi:predicted lipoprotein with Yx(FWY)xxD motif
MKDNNATNTMSPDSRQVSAQEKPAVKSDFNIISLLVALVIVVILAFTTVMLFLQSEAGSEESVVPEMVLIEDVDLVALANEKEIEIGAQGLVGIYVTEDQDIYLTHAQTGQTLYFKEEGFCVDGCREEWVPYAIESELVSPRLQSYLVNEELGTYFVTLDGKLLFTYQGDRGRGESYGDGKDGEWQIARP